MSTEEDKKLVIVEWRDIIATSGWEQDLSCPTLFTVGWLISQDNETILIANTKDPDDFAGNSEEPMYYGLSAFPSGAVVCVHQCGLENNDTKICLHSSQIFQPK